MLDTNEQFLNGAFARPTWGPVDTVSAGPEAPNAPTARPGASSSNAILIAWIVLLVLVILANVLTFEVQR